MPESQATTCKFEARVVVRASSSRSRAALSAALAWRRRAPGARDAGRPSRAGVRRRRGDRRRRRGERGARAPPARRARELAGSVRGPRVRVGLEVRHASSRALQKATTRPLRVRVSAPPPRERPDDRPRGTATGATPLLASPPRARADDSPSHPLSPARLAPRVLLIHHTPQVAAEDDFRAFRGLRVGVLTNPSGVMPSTLEHAVDVLGASPNVDLVAVFAPEHGFRGAAQAGSSREPDAATRRRSGEGSPPLIPEDESGASEKGKIPPACSTASQVRRRDARPDFRIRRGRDRFRRPGRRREVLHVRLDPLRRHGGVRVAVAPRPACRLRPAEPARRRGDRGPRRGRGRVRELPRAETHRGEARDDPRRAREDVRGEVPRRGRRSAGRDPEAKERRKRVGRSIFLREY